MANNSFDVNSIHRKKWFWLSVAIGAIGVIAVGAAWLSGNDKKSGFIPTNTKKLSTTNVASPGEQIKPEDVWRAMSEAQIKNLETSDREKGEKLKQIMEDFEKFKKETKKQQDGKPDDKNKRATDAHVPPLPPVAGSTPPSGVDVGPERFSQLGRKNRNGPGAQGQAMTPTTGIMTVSFGESATDVSRGFAKTTAASKDRKKKERRTVDHYIPSGSFTPAVILGGVDAASGGQSQHNPQPIILQLTDFAILPNKFRYDVQSCFVVGGCYGDIQAERAYCRLESLSCVLKDNTAVDVAVKGAIFDETGKAGIRGRVVEKTGQILARALVAGIAGGIGKAFQGTATTQSISPLGSTSSIDPDKVAQAAIGSGISTAGEKLADYYIKQASSLFPVIEVDSGRVVDVVFTQGVDLGKFETQAQAGEATPSSAPQAMPKVAPRTAMQSANFTRRENRGTDPADASVR